MSNYAPNSTTNMDIMKTRKTRIEALNDRINDADNYLNNFLPEEGKENTSPAHPTKVLIQRMEKMLGELNEMKELSNIDQAAIDKEVASLPSRSLITLSVAKVKVVNENTKMKEQMQEREEYIKRLEQEVLKQRLDLENVKKNENENMVKISTMEDQIRILKSKAFGFDIAKKYEYYKEKQGKTGGAAQIEDENLAYAMWEKENYDSKKAPARLEKMETSKQMWIRDSQNNIDKLVYDVDVANSYNNVNGINTSNQNVNSAWKSSNRQNTNNSIGTNMRKITPMILNNNNTNF